VVVRKEEGDVGKDKGASPLQPDEVKVAYGERIRFVSSRDADADLSLEEGARRLLSIEGRHDRDIALGDVVGVGVVHGFGGRTR
jgi:hypothetical protein